MALNLPTYSMPFCERCQATKEWHRHPNGVEFCEWRHSVNDVISPINNLMAWDLLTYSMPFCDGRHSSYRWHNQLSGVGFVDLLWAILWRTPYYSVTQELLSPSFNFCPAETFIFISERYTSELWLASIRKFALCWYEILSGWGDSNLNAVWYNTPSMALKDKIHKIESRENRRHPHTGAHIHI
jgi:hypothetical protein